MSASEQQLRQLLGALAVLACALCTSQFAEVSWGRLFDAAAIRNAEGVFLGLLSPDLGGAFLARVLRLMIQSVAIAAAGLCVALLLGVPLALVAARGPRLIDAPGARWPIVGQGARLLLSFLRAVPELVWAFLLVRIFGLGPAPAVFAIGLSFSGIIGKLFAELLEAAPAAPTRTLLAMGAARGWALAFGAVPEVASAWTGYALFRFECAVRSATVLGVVGAGGIGHEIALAVRYLEFDKLGSALAVMLTTVLLIEALSARLRRLRGWGIAPIFGVAFAALVAEVDLWAAVSRTSLTQLQLFLESMVGWPDFGPLQVGRWMLQTLSIAFLGTALAAVPALSLSIWASQSRWAFLPIRALFAIFRALPELVWALIFVVWVGPGAYAGILAIAAHSAGVLGRLFLEVIEEVEPSAPAALTALGASRWETFLFGVWPQALPRFFSYATYRFEVNVRATVMIGFVGAGGIGSAIHTAISLFHGAELGALLVILCAVVFLLDALFGALRSRWVEGPITGER